MSRWTLLACAIPYATWHEHVEEQKRLKRAAEKVVKRWQHMALSVPFESWSSNVREQKRMASVAEKIVRRSCTSALLSLYSSPWDGPLSCMRV
jgi:predicted outer membrane lipoprotein